MNNRLGKVSQGGEIVGRLLQLTLKIQPPMEGVWVGDEKCIERRGFIVVAWRVIEGMVLLFSVLVCILKMIGDLKCRCEVS